MWTCNLCDIRGPGDAVDFNRHYLREHYEQTTYAAGNRRGSSRSKSEEVREVRDGSGVPVQPAPSEAERNGRVEGSGDQLAGEYPPALW